MSRMTRVAVAVALGLTVALYGCGGSAKTEEPAPEETVESVEEEAEDEAAKAAAEAEAAAQAEAEAAAKAEAEAAAAVEAEHEAARSSAEGEGLSVFTGVVHVMTGEELCAYENKPVEMFYEDAASDTTYVILELDETVHVVGELADGSPGEGDADHIGIGRDIPAFDFVEDSASFWTDYDGQRVCVAGNPWFQTDVSLPYAPRMYDAQLLYVE